MSKEWKWTEPCHVNKAFVEMVKWNKLEKGDYILFSNIPVRVVRPPRAPNEKVKVFQWDTIDMELGPWSYYYKLVEVREYDWLCPHCFSTPVEEKKAICQDCQEAAETDDDIGKLYEMEAWGDVEDK